MTKNNKFKMLTDEDVKIIKSDPEGLSDYIVRTKVKEARKTAIIVTLISVVIAFAGGAFCGLMTAKSSIPNNVVQIQLGDKNEDSTTEVKKAETKAKVEK